MKFKAIVLDFDGVLVESNEIKHRAFAALFAEFPAHYEAIMAYHRAHNAVNRHEKFRYIMEKILGLDYDPGLAAQWAGRFSALTREQIINCPAVDGAADFISFFHKHYPLYIASATPLDELQLILAGRHLTSYFKGVFGAPMAKTAMFAAVAARENIPAAAILFIGDSREDYQAAAASGVGFIARRKDYDFKTEGVRSFSTLSEIKDHLLNQTEGVKVA